MTQPPAPPSYPNPGWQAPPKKPTNKKPWLIGGGILLLVAVAYSAGASGGVEDGMDAALVTPSPTENWVAPSQSTPVATDVASDAPTPTTTPEPTPEPTTNTGYARWMEYVDRSSDASDAIVGGMESASEAFGNYDISEAEDAMRETRSLIRTEMAWMEDHPPAECYKNVYQLHLAAFQDYDGAFTAGIKFLSSFENKDFDRFVALSESGTENLSAATDALSSATAACSS